MRPLASRLLLLCLLVAPVPGRAVVHTTGDGTGNTTPPPDDPGFANVGYSLDPSGTKPDLQSAVYLGNRWVLTAAHVGELHFVFGGVTYAPVPGSLEVIEKPPGTPADLALVRIGSEPPLPPVVLSSASPAVTDLFTMIGNGRNRQPDLTCWSYPDFASEITCPPGPFPQHFTGYKLAAGRIIRWGANAVTQVGTDVTIQGHTTRVFTAAFDESGLTDEALLVDGDSGGPAFLKRGSTWELVGINVGMAAYAGQPAAAVFGNVSLIADVFHYRSEIEAAMSRQVPSASWPALVLGACGLIAVATRVLASS